MFVFSNHLKQKCKLFDRIFFVVDSFLDGAMSEEIGDTIVQSVQNGCGTARPFVCKDPNLTYKQQNRT